MIDDILKFLSYYKSVHPNQPYFNLLIKIRFKEGSYRTLGGGAIRTSFISKHRDELMMAIIRMFRRRDFWAMISGEPLAIRVNNSEDDERILPGGSILLLYKPSDYYTNTKYNDRGVEVKDKNAPWYHQINKKFKIANVELPLHMDLTYWPNIKLNEEGTRGIGYFEDGDGNAIAEYVVTINEDHYVLRASYSRELAFVIKDTTNGQDLT